MIVFGGQGLCMFYLWYKGWRYIQASREELVGKNVNKASEAVLMNKSEFAHIFTTVKDDKDVVQHYNSCFSRKITDQIQSITLGRDIVFDKEKTNSIISSLRTARKNKVRLVLHIDSVQTLRAFPSDLLTAIGS